MPVPKRKLTRSRSRSRRSANLRMTAPAHSVCANCGASHRPHTVCTNCGWYRGRAAIDVE
ncbi:MAG TPA: 50S ribosomal protein L32 [Acidimicrobiia bacterium]|jgi:large subunit ribosomal protein L32